MASAFKARVIHTAVSNSPGTVDYTVSGFGTVVGVMLIATVGKVDDTVANGWSQSWGVTDGTRHRGCYTNSRNNVATGVSKASGTNDSTLIKLYTASSNAVVCNAAFDSFITDGIRLNWTVEAPLGETYRLTIVLFGGSQCQCYVTNATPPATTGATTVTPGFAADFVFTHTMATTDASQLNQADYGPGISLRNSGSPLNYGLQMLCDRGTTSQARTVLLNTDLGEAITVSTTDTVAGISRIQNYGSTTFDLVNSNSLQGPMFAMLAMKVTGTESVGIAVNETLCPTSTGVVGYTFPGFHSGFLYALTSNNTTVSNTNDAAGGIGVSDFVSASSSEWVGGKSGAATSKTSCMGANVPIDVFDADRVRSYKASISSADVNGHSLNFSNVPASGRKFIQFIIGLPTHSTSTTVSAARATAAISSKVIHQTSPTAHAARATAHIVGQVIHRTSPTVQASRATAAIAAKVVHKTSVACQATRATAHIVAQVVHKATAAVQAPRATAHGVAQVVHQTSVAVAAARATAHITATRIHFQATIVANASRATAHVAEQVVHQTSTAVHASRATSAIASKVVHQTSTACQAQRATAHLSGQVIHRTAVAVQAQRATAAVASKVVHQTTHFTPQAQTATTAIGVTLAGIIGSAIDAHAGAAHTVVPSKIVHQTTDGSVAASRATAHIAAQRVIQATIVANATRATCSIHAQKKRDASAACQAQRATAHIVAQVIHQSSVAVQAQRATCHIVGGPAGGVLHCQAQRATTHIVGQIVHQASPILSALPAHTALIAKVVHQTSLAVHAQRATAHLTGQFTKSAAIAAHAARATAASSGQIVHQVALLVHANPAHTIWIVQRVHQTDLALHAARATTHIFGGEGFGVDLDCHALRATAHLIGQVIHQGVIVAQADPCRARLLDYPVAWYTPEIILRPIPEDFVLEVGPFAATLLLPMPEQLP